MFVRAAFLPFIYKAHKCTSLFVFFFFTLIGLFSEGHKMTDGLDDGASNGKDLMSAICLAI